MFDSKNTSCTKFWVWQRYWKMGVDFPKSLAETPPFFGLWIFFKNLTHVCSSALNDEVSEEKWPLMSKTIVLLKNDLSWAKWPFCGLLMVISMYLGSGIIFLRPIITHYANNLLLLSVCPGLILIFCNCSCPLLYSQNQTPLGVTIAMRRRLSSTDQNWRS